jgi:DNA (cytosine-5)-methyltransferase 1
MRAIDLFCGAGGSSFGAQAGGATMVGAVDAWDIATATYADNFPAAKRNVVTRRLTDRSGTDLFDRIGRVDLLLASPDCTNHSIARGAMPRCGESQRSGWYVRRFLEDLEPRWIVLENVTGMQRWKGFGGLIHMLEKRYGYRLRVQILDAADFGVPQRRRRLFIIGDRRKEPRPIEVPSGRHVSVRRILDPVTKWPADPVFNGKRPKATLERVQRGINALGKGKDFLIVYYGSDAAGGWQTLDRPLRTLTTLDRFGLIRWDGKTPTLRMLQVPELARAMGLADPRAEASSTFLLNRGTRRDKIKLLGNGVCAPVMAAIANSLAEAVPSVPLVAAE